MRKRERECVCVDGWRGGADCFSFPLSKIIGNLLMDNRTGLGVFVLSVTSFVSSNCSCQVCHGHFHVLPCGGGYVATASCIETWTV